MTDRVTYRKLHEPLNETTYEVFADGRPVGFIWSVRVLSYRGMQGWNRGVRIKDFHPLEWRYGRKLHTPLREFRTARTRGDAARELVALAQVQPDGVPEGKR